MVRNCCCFTCVMGDGYRVLCSWKQFIMRPSVRECVCFVIYFSVREKITPGNRSERKPITVKLKTDKLHKFRKCAAFHLERHVLLCFCFHISGCFCDSHQRLPSDKSECESIFGHIVFTISGLIIFVVFFFTRSLLGLFRMYYT